MLQLSTVVLTRQKGRLYRREGGREASTSLMTTLYLCLLMNEARRARHGVPDFHGYSLIIPADASRPRRESESVGSIQYMSDHF